MNELALKTEDIGKRYRLGVIGTTTFQDDFKRLVARAVGKPDPTAKIGARAYEKNAEFWALRHINFEVERGQAVGIIGRNGAGKSTLLKLLSRITSPSEGAIYLNGRVASMLEVGTGFHPEMTGRENIFMNGAILGMSRAETERKISQIIDFSECGPFIDTPVKRYSSGMYVKLAFSVSAFLDNEILIMDEVLAVGDVAFQQKCLDRMREIADEGSRTILYVSHNMSTIKRLCDRCIVLDKGAILCDGGVDEAISIYTGAGDIQLSDVHYEFPDQEQRRRAHGALAHSLDLTERESCSYNSDEPLVFDLCWSRTDGEQSPVMLRAVVRYGDSSLVGTSVSAPFTAAPNGARTQTRFLLDLSALPPGRYFFRFDLFCDDPQNPRGFRNLTTVSQEIRFEVRARSRAVWEHNYWGHIRLPQAQVID